MNYGYSVGISGGGVAFVGCPDDGASGTVYVYGATMGNYTHGNSWTQISKLPGYDHPSRFFVYIWKLSSSLGAGDNSFGTAISVLTTNLDTSAHNGTVTVLVGADTSSESDDYC
jgi:hypothetical protein